MAWNRADFAHKLRMGPFKTVSSLAIQVMTLSGDNRTNPFDRHAPRAVDRAVIRVWDRFRDRF